MAMHGTRTLCETDAQCAVSEFQEAMSCRTASCSDLIGGSMAFNGPSMVSSLDFQVCSCSFRIFNEFNEFVVQVSRNEIKNEFEGEDHATLRFIALPTCKAAEKFQEMQASSCQPHQLVTRPAYPGHTSHADYEAGFSACPSLASISSTVKSLAR